MEVLAHSLKIKDTHGAVLFSADKNEVMIGANSLRIDGDGGAVFRESVQTSVIRAEPGRELKYDLKINSDIGRKVYCCSSYSQIRFTDTVASC